jgi:hypothetical protein
MDWLKGKMALCNIAIVQLSCLFIHIRRKQKERNIESSAPIMIIIIKEDTYISVDSAHPRKQNSGKLLF